MAANRLPAGRWVEVVDRDRARCQASAYGFGSTEQCRGPNEVHHKILRGLGGTSDPSIHDLDRLVTLCGRHHMEVHAHPARARSCGLIERRTP